MLEVRIPKTIVQLNVTRSRDLVIMIFRYTDGIATRYDGTYSYSRVGNFVRGNSVDPFRKRVGKVISETKDILGSGLPTEIAHTLVSPVEDAIIKSEGEIYDYFVSFNNAIYDEIKDSWS